MLISVIILASDSHLNKGKSVLHSLHLLACQRHCDKEIIIVENSTDKSLLGTLETTLASYVEQGLVRSGYVINIDQRVCRGAARNQGASQANGDILVFFDDDTIPLHDNILSLIEKHSYESGHGYGADRMWTSGTEFQDSSASILIGCINSDISLLTNISEFPQKGVRDQSDRFMLARSFIGNVGYVRKNLFEQAGGFPEYEGYGFEDDCLMYRLFILDGYPAILDDVHVVHVNHSIDTTVNKKALIAYHTELISNGHYWFHVSHLLDSSFSGEISDVVEPLHSIHYDHRIENAYKRYFDMLPLNLFASDDLVSQKWISCQQYSLQKYARVINQLLHSKTLDHFVKNSEGDFDNLAPVLKSAIETNLLTIQNDGLLLPNFLFCYTRLSAHPLSTFTLNLDPKLNQFPCDKTSAHRRINLLKQRYPYTEYLSLGIIGDDDLVSLALADEHWLFPTVVEIDPQIISHIRQTVPRAKLINKDVISILSDKPKPHLHTFITDPPYTLHGATAFVAAGIRLIDFSDHEAEFYVVLNETMMGTYMTTFLKQLSDCGVHLTETIRNFSQYKLPDTFPERDRANFFLRSQSIDETSLKYSSSSNLYIFSAVNPNIDLLITYISPELMYTHLI